MSERFFVPVVSLAATLTLVSCSGSSKVAESGFTNSSSGSSGTSGSSGSAGSGPGTFGSGGSSSSGSGASADCSEAAKLVYVVTIEKALYSFRPNTLTFSKVGTLNCDAGTATPNSMAVDRSGVAWVNYTDSSLFKVSTKDATCEPTSYARLQNEWERLGMAFSSNSAGSTDETLFVMATKKGQNRNPGLGTIDLRTMKLSVIGDYTGPLQSSQNGELTGSGDGRLFGFFSTQPASFAEVLKATAATPTVRTLDGVDTGVGLAFSFWGGDFWFYTAAKGETSKVTQLKYATDQSLSIVKSDLGFTIVGAGVSTCAPTSPVK
jgi:hypothetical protein